MEVTTKYNGIVEIEEDKVIQFPNGIPGFVDETEFILHPFSDDTPFIILQSINMAELAFVLINPFEFFQNYEFNLPTPVVDILEIEDEKDVITYCILTINDPFEKTTANLKAPVVINSKKRLAKQLVLNDPQYKTKHELFTQKQAAAKEG